MVKKDSLNDLTYEEMLGRLSIEEEIGRLSSNATPSKSLESKIDFYTPFFNEQTEEKKIYPPFSPTKCKNLIFSNQQRYNSISIHPKKLDFSNLSTNKKKRKRAVDN